MCVCVRMYRFVCTFVYYGIAFLTPRLFEGGSVYRSAFITTSAEIPGFLFPAVFLDWIGRKKTLIVTFCLTSAACLCLTLPLETSTATLFVFLARMSITGAFAVTYVYTPEIYPTTVRTTGLGAASSMARLAGIVTMFISQDLNVLTSVLVYGVVAVIGAIAAYMLRTETKGIALPDVLPEPKQAATIKKGNKMYSQFT